MQAKHQLYASPRNVTVNILDGNSFFTLDYQQKYDKQREGQRQKQRQRQRLDKVEMNNTFTNFLGNQSISLNNDKKNCLRKNGTPNCINVGNVKSAQYHRKLLNTNIANRMSINPYIRIRRVDQIIQQRKQRQASLQQNQQKARQRQQTPHLPNVMQSRTQQIDRSTQKQKLLKNLTIDPQTLQQQHSPGPDSQLRKASKTLNPFCENYKNRRKLLDRINQRKLYNRNTSPIRWDSRIEDMEKLRTKKYGQGHLYGGAADGVGGGHRVGLGFLNREKDPLLRSIEGNKIKYNHHDVKYYKGKIQQVNAL